MNPVTRMYTIEHVPCPARDGCEDNLWRLDVEEVPHVKNGAWHVRIVGSEAEVQRAGVFARRHEEIGIGDLEEALSTHVWGPNR